MRGQGKTQETQPGEDEMPASGRLKQEDLDFKSNLGYTAREPSRRQIQTQKPGPSASELQGCSSGCRTTA